MKFSKEFKIKKQRGHIQKNTPTKIISNEKGMRRFEERYADNI